MSDKEELLFFDTFAHENSEELNLDLVQFTKPVYVTEVRIIPLGARVQADFPGGVRLGATNPSQFQIEFFVNDLGKPGASTFESLGGFEYNQNGCINLECLNNGNSRKIPTDGLVLRGLYTTITLAVYGKLTANITEQIIQPVVNPTLPAQPNTIPDVQQISAIENEWPSQEQIQSVPIEYPQQNATQQYPATAYVSGQDQYNQEYNEYYNEVPKDPRSYHHTPEAEWENKTRGRSSERDREHNNQDRDRRDGEREKRYTRSQSRDRERNGSRDYREPSREREWSERDKRHEYRERDKDWERERDRDRYGKHQDYKRGYARDERDDTRKRPRTPPILSPKRPHTPHSERKETSPPEVDDLSEEDTNNNAAERREKETADVHQLAATASIAPVKGATPPKEVKDNVDEPPLMDVEEFEPILSDEDILDDNDHYHQEIDFDYTAYTNNDDLMKLFEPGTNDVQAYDDDNRPYEIRGDKIETSEELKVVIGIADDFFKSSITRFAIASFASLSKEFKEEFINLAEKIANTIGDIENFRTIVDIYTKTRGTNSKFDADSAEIVDSAKYVIETLLDWVEIASSYEMANAQDKPGYKIRHLKCGIQLLEWSCCSLDFVRLLWDRGFDIQTTLIDLYKQEYMAVSIRLMILRALDAYLHHKLTVERFLMYDATGKKMGNGFLDNGSLPENNGYQLTIELLRLNPSVRLKFALQSILKKLNLFEVTYRVQNCLAKYKSQDLDLDNIDFLAKALTQILQAIENGEFAFAQPKRFLPVAAQFEIQRDDTKPVIIKYFAMHKVLQCMLLMLNHPCTMNLTNVRTPIYQILEALSKNMSGLRYMCDNIDTINFLVKSLLQMQYEFQPAIEINSQRLGQEIAYKLQSLYHIDRLNSLGKRTNVDCESPDVIDQLHALYCLTLSKIGRIACAEVFALNDNVNAILRYVNVPRDKPEVQLVKLRKSPATGYVIDLLYNVFVYTTNTTSFIVANGKQLTNVVVHIRDGFDEAIVSKVNEIEQHLKPFDGFKPLNYDNIKPYVEIVNKHSDATVGYSGPLTSALRIIEHLGVSPHANGTPILNENPLNNYVELKYKHVILQLFSQGGVATLSAILEKICEHYEQPAVFASTFVSVHGVHLLNVIEPCVELLKQMLTYVIQCRNTSFKDLTTVPILLHTFNLLRHYPTTSAVYYRAQNVCGRLLATLLVYTQPISEEIHEKDSLNKTLWTLMCGEVIKFAAASPHTFVSGLSILSELLPLPLPVQSRVDLKADEVTWEINLRKLWSAHLHAHNAAMQDLINRLCVTAHQPLLNLLRRVCVQLADLAANSAITIARGLLDTIRNALTCDKDAGDENDGKSIVVSPCNGHVARLLNFLACLVTHANLKYAVLQLLQNHAGNAAKGDEKYPALVPLFLQILKTKSTQNAHVQSQECILSIVQSLCDTEITLMQNADGETVSSDVYLANALPTKETLLMFIDGMIEHAMADNGFLTCLPIVRTFLLLTEHDYGFYHLKENLMKKCVPLLPMLNKLDTNFAKDNAECLSTLNTLLEFLRVSSTIDEVEEGLQYKARTLKMSIEEIKGLIGWDNFKETDNDKKHPLINLETVLKKLAQEDATFETLLESLNAIVNLLNTSQSTDECKIVVVEPILPAPESLLAQFAGRPVYTTTEAISDERLTASYWLTVPTDETDADSENVTCDLIEICRQTLSQDVNLIREVEKICRICSASNGTEQNDSKEKPIDLQKEKLKRPFVTPSRGRGFPRTIQQRSDLFRSRPPNTSRPPSLHVDDFVALETCGAQPTGPTGYNRISREILATSRIARGTRGRAFVASERAVQYRQMHWWGSNLGRGPYQ